jgi:hypothetical protein
MKKVLTKVTIEIIVKKIYEWKKLPMPLHEKRAKQGFFGRD